MVDPFDDPPIEVIRVHLQMSDMLNTALYAGFFVLMLVVAARNPDARGSFVGFAAAFLVLSILFLLVSLRARVEIHRAGLLRRYRLRTYRYAWGDIAKVVLDPGHRLLNPRPAPVLVLTSGRRVEIVELKALLWVPFWRVSVSPEARALVEAVDLRIDHPVEPEATEAAPGLSPPPRAWVVGPLVACLALFVVALAVAMLVMPFAGSTAAVDPPRLPPGRLYFGEPAPGGGTSYWVDCPRPVTSAFGSDPICRRDGRDALRNSVVGLVFCAVLAALLVWYVRHLRRRYRRWHEATAALNA